MNWTKDNAVSGYYIQYSTDRNFKNGVKKITINQRNKVTLKKVSSKKTYYVRIASYKKVGGKTYVGSYSTAKKVRVK